MTTGKVLDLPYYCHGFIVCRRPDETAWQRARRFLRDFPGERFILPVEGDYQSKEGWHFEIPRYPYTLIVRY